MSRFPDDELANSKLNKEGCFSSSFLMTCKRAGLSMQGILSPESISYGGLCRRQSGSQNTFIDSWLMCDLEGTGDLRLEVA